jgi:hypothetical protein
MTERTVQRQLLRARGAVRRANADVADVPSAAYIAAHAGP